MFGRKILASVLLVISLASVFFMPLQANGQTLQPQKITGFSQNILEVHYQETTGILWALGGSRAVEGIGYLYDINPVTRTITTTYNVSSSLNGGAPWGLWCSTTSCFVTSRDSGNPQASVGSIIRIESVGADKGLKTGQFNATNDDRGFGRIDGRDSTGIGIGGIALYVESYTSGNVIKGIIVGAVGSMQKTTDITMGGVSGNGGVGAYDLRWTGIAGNTKNYLYTLIPNLVNTVFLQQYNLATLGQECLATVNITGAGESGGQIIIDMTNNRVFISAGDNGNYHQMATSCVVTSNAITPTEHGLSNVVTQKNGITIPDRSAIFFQESAGNARVSVASYDFATGTFGTNPLVVDVLPSTSQPKDYGRAYFAVNHDDNGQITTQANIGTNPVFNAVFIPMNADKAIYVFRFEGIEVIGGEGERPAVLPENSIAELSGLMLCMGGLIAPSNCNTATGMPNNTDPKTNGTGVAILIFAIILSYAFLVSIHYRAKTQLSKDNVHLVEVMNIHPVILVIMLIADFALVWYMGYLSDIVFYTMIVAIVGLGALGFYGKIRGFG